MNYEVMLMITKEQYARFDDICHKLYVKSSETGKEAGYFTKFNESHDIFVELSCVTAVSLAIGYYTFRMLYKQPDMNFINLFETWFESYDYDEDLGSIDLINGSLEYCVMTLESF